MRPRAPALAAALALRVASGDRVDDLADHVLGAFDRVLDRVLEALDRRLRRGRVGGGLLGLQQNAAAWSPRPSAWSLRRAYSGSRSIRLVSSGVAMKIVETAPTLMPTMIANAKSCSVGPPRKNSATIGRSVITEVTIDRLSTSHTETLAIVAMLARGIRRMFSRTRSKTMIVS